MIKLKKIPCLNECVLATVADVDYVKLALERANRPNETYSS